MTVLLERRIAAVRRFNRFYTQRIGVLGNSHLESDFSLTEVRVLYEVGHRDAPMATELANDLGLDAGYLSRILRRFEQHKLVRRSTSADDARRRHLRLTNKGRAILVPIESRARGEIARLLAPLPGKHQAALVRSMRTVEGILDTKVAQHESVVLRQHRPGDMGWVVHRHGVLYAEEYGWDIDFEALVAEIVAKFIHEFDPKRERCWIAEREGEILGCVFLVRQSEEVAKLRLLLVEPGTRGLGLGTRLVQECTDFARAARYARITLWTQSILGAARRVYEHAGYALVKEEPHHSFGHDLVAQTWELAL